MTRFFLKETHGAESQQMPGFFEAFAVSHVAILHGRTSISRMAGRLFRTSRRGVCPCVGIARFHLFRLSWLRASARYPAGAEGRACSREGLAADCAASAGHCVNFISEVDASEQCVFFGSGRLGFCRACHHTNHSSICPRQPGAGEGGFGDVASGTDRLHGDATRGSWRGSNRSKSSPVM